ncbi:MAG: cytochrome P450 [Pseudonocardiales bacterium]|nr:cytochrome P450 [Pseudonocardiales bacterium]MBV9031367.1 cytochrome P450 [Pseudonocardiales bacterium]MBW0009398.1 cytochrome P450 [Pseudonocardiales bacterium]
MTLRRGIRWVVRHGLVRRTVQRQMRAGDLGSRLMMDPTIRENPFPCYDELRAQGRLVRTDLALLSAHHDVCLAVLRSPDFGQMCLDQVPGILRLGMRLGGHPVLTPIEPPSMLVVNPPEHTRYRKLVTRAFCARTIAAMRPRIEQIAEDLLDEIAQSSADGPVDLVSRYASLLPATVIAEMLGAPVAMRRQFLDWGAGAALSLDIGLSYRDFRRTELDITALHRWMLGHFADVRRTPRDGVLSSLVAAHDQGDQLTLDELSSIAMLLLAAGFETTINLLGNGAVLLMRHPDQLDVLRAQPQRWAGAVEEILRYDSPVQRTGRLAQRDTEVAGCPVKAGSFIVVLLGGANRDPAVFPDPHRFDVTRPEADQNLAFSSGIHYCIGAALARLEGEIGLRALFRRFPDLALTGTPHRRPTRVLRGYDAISVRLTSPALTATSAPSALHPSEQG